MAIEDELLEEMVQVFQRLRRMVERFRSRSGVLRGQSERMLREAMRDWLREDPQANALRQRMEAREFERRVAAEVDRVLEDRLEPQNDPNDLNRNGRDDARDRRGQDEEVRDDREDRDRDEQDRDEQDRDEQDREENRERDEQDREENREREEEQQVEQNPDHVRLDLVPVAAGAAAAAEAEELAEERQDEQDQSQQADGQEVGEQDQGAGDQVDGQQQEGPEDQRDPEVLQADADGQQYAPSVIGAEEERAEALEERDSEVLQADADGQQYAPSVIGAEEERAEALEDERDPEVLQADADGQQYAPAVIGADAHDELEDEEQQPEQEQGGGTEQQALPTVGDRRAEVEAARQAGEQNQGEQPGRHRPEVVEARLTAEQDQPGQQQDQPGPQGQAATGPDAGMSDEVQKLRDLSQRGLRPASQAAQRPGSTPEARPHGGVTAGQQHQRTTQGTGREVDRSSGGERT